MPLTYATRLDFDFACAKDWVEVWEQDDDVKRDALDAFMDALSKGGFKKAQQKLVTLYKNRMAETEEN